MIRPLSKEEMRKFVKDMYKELHVVAAHQLDSMNIEELKHSAMTNNKEALVELLIREERGELSDDKHFYRIIEMLLFEAVDDIQHDPEQTLKRAFWQMTNLKN